MLPRSRLTEQSTTKKRLAVVVSSTSYHREPPDLILMAVTSQIRSMRRSGDIVGEVWKEAGLGPPNHAP